MAVKNSTILDRIWLEGTWDYQQRVPQASQQGVAAVAEFLFDPMNKMYYNQFVDALVNRIGMTRINSKIWDNPWSTFKKGNLPFGSSVQDMGIKWLKAHTFEDDSKNLLEIRRPEIEAAYYTINRRDQYTISTNYDELRNAFVDEYGLNKLINSITDVPISSDNYDEFLAMKDLIAEYESRYGFYKEQITAITNEQTAKDFLVKARAFAGKLRFPSVYYNLVEIPTFADESELVLLIDPQSLAYTDVEALAAAFNINKAEIKYRIELVDEWPIPGAVALLTTEDFFQVYDALYTTTSFYNPQNLTTNYYLTHWEIIAFSPFVPAILFTTEDGTGIDTVTYNQPTIEFIYVDKNDNVIPYDTTYDQFKEGVYVKSKLISPDVPDGLEFVGGVQVKLPQACSVQYQVEGASSSSTFPNLNTDSLFIFDPLTNKLSANIDDVIYNIKNTLAFTHSSGSVKILSISAPIAFYQIYINPSTGETTTMSLIYSTSINDINVTLFE